MDRLKTFALLLLLFCAWLPSVLAQEADNPTQAVVRIKSHGASATIIGTSQEKSWLLGCAHMITNKDGDLDQELYQRPLQIDGPPQPFAKHKTARARIVAHDLELDLTLIEIDNGPFRFIPVAPKGHKPSQRIKSLGFDNQQYPITVQNITIWETSEFNTYTREKPWHGRSGGGLIDMEAKVLIGVVQGYEITDKCRGIYISHQAVLRFLASAWGKNQLSLEAASRLEEYSQPRSETSP